MEHKTRQCNYCNNEFQDTNTRGTEQKYCSIKCRTNAANKRHKENLIKQIEMKYEQDNRNTINGNVQTSNGKEQYSNNNDNIREENLFNATRGIGNTDVLRLVEKNYQTKVESLSYELKNEQLLKENEELKRRVAMLEVEVEELESELEQEPEQSGMIGSVMEQFKQDPLNTINFATTLIQNLFKQKPNEVANEEKK
jgi:hypothetical protein